MEKQKVDKIQYRGLCEDEIRRELFNGFIRHQVVTKCWRRENGEWIIKDAPFIDDWTEEDYQTLIVCLKNTVCSSGFVYAAFYDGELKGFVSVESDFLGRNRNILIYQVSTCPRTGVGWELGKCFFRQQKTGQ